MRAGLRRSKTLRAACALQSPQTPVVLAYLEFLDPILVEAARRLAETGCTEVSIVPLFLGAGGHVRKDLPQLLRATASSLSARRLAAAPGHRRGEPVVQAMADASLALLRGVKAPPRR